MKSALTAPSSNPRSRATALSAGPPPAPPSMPNGSNADTMQPQAPQGAQPQPAPTHQQTVAALRHFNAILGELRGLLENPDLGKANLKSSIIDGTSKLVAQRIMSPADAVTQLATVPERPFEQKQWAENHYSQIVQAQAAVLDHHRTQALGTGNYELESMLHDDGNADDHMNTMRGMMQSHYGNPPQQQ